MLLELRDVTKVYQTSEKVFGAHNTSLKIESGDFVALVGPSGSGKTTILNLISGLISPDKGEILFNETRLDSLTPDEKTRHRLMNMGFVFQDYQLLPHLTVAENVELPMRLRGLEEKYIQDQVKWALEHVGLTGYGKRYSNELSGGQQQRVSVARAIAPKPLLILADEPTANLDSKTAMDMIKLFRSLNHDSKLTFIFSTHDQRIIDQVDRVIKIQDGVLQ